MYCLQVRFPSGREFLEHSFDAYPAGGIHVPHRLGLKESDLVCVEIEFPSLSDPCFLFGVVSRLGIAMMHAGKRKRYTEVRFCAEEEYVRTAMIKIAYRDLSEFHTRQKAREDVNLEVRVQNRQTGNTIDMVTEDIGPGGAFLPSRELLKIGTELNLSFFVPGFSTNLFAAGKVVHHGLRRQGGRRGMGVQFLTDAKSEEKKLRALYRHIVANKDKETIWRLERSPSG